MLVTVAAGGSGGSAAVASLGGWSVGEPGRFFHMKASGAWALLALRLLDTRLSSSDLHHAALLWHGLRQCFSSRLSHCRCWPPALWKGAGRQSAGGLCPSSGLQECGEAGSACKQRIKCREVSFELGWQLADGPRVQGSERRAKSSAGSRVLTVLTDDRRPQAAGLVGPTCGVGSGSRLPFPIHGGGDIRTGFFKVTSTEAEKINEFLE